MYVRTYIYTPGLCEDRDNSIVILHIYYHVNEDELRITMVTLLSLFAPKNVHMSVFLTQDLV